MDNKDKLTRKRLLRYAVQGITLGVVASTAVLIYTSEPSERLQHLRDFDWGFLFICLALVVTAWLCNGLRTLLLSRSLGYRLTGLQSLCVTLSTEFGMAATPAGMGGAVIRLSFLRFAGIPIAHGTSIYATDMILDTIFFILLFPFAVYSFLDNQYLFKLLRWKDPSDLYFFGGCLLFGLLLILLFLRLGLHHDLWQILTKWEPSQRYRLPARARLLKWRVAREYQKFIHGLKELFKIPRGLLTIIFLIASVQWCCRYGVLSVLLYAFGVPNNPAIVFLLQGILFTIAIMVVLPGGGGGVEVLTALVLNQMINPSLVGLVILIWRFFTYYLYLLAGGTMFLWAISEPERMFPQMKQTPMEQDGELDTVNLKKPPP